MGLPDYFSRWWAPTVMVSTKHRACLSIFLFPCVRSFCLYLSLHCFFFILFYFILGGFTTPPVALFWTKVASDLREHMEIVHTSEYPHFINSLLNCFVELLKTRLPPQVRRPMNCQSLIFSTDLPPNQVLVPLIFL